MVEPVARLINGRGFRIRRARDVGLADEDDQTVVEYCLRWTSCSSPLTPICATKLVEATAACSISRHLNAQHDIDSPTRLKTSSVICAEADASSPCDATDV